MFLLFACVEKQTSQDTGNESVQNGIGNTPSTEGLTDLNTIDATPVEITVNGAIDNIYALKDSNTVLAWGTNHSGKYTLWNVNSQTASAVELSEGLPYADQRSYNKPLQLQNGNLAICYQSDARFAGQDGTQHGVLIIDPLTGEEIEDIAFASASNPEGLIEQNGRLYVLAANRQTNEAPSLLVYNSNSYEKLNEQTLSTDARNASDLEFYTDKNGNSRLLISATTTETTTYSADGTGGVLDNSAVGKVLVVNPNDLSIVSSHITSANMGIDIAVDDENNLAVLSGVGTEASPLAFGVLDLDAESGSSFDANWIGDIISDETTENGAGGVFPFGVNTRQGFMTTNFIDGSSRHPVPTVMDLSSSEYIVLVADPATVSTPLIDNGDGQLVYAANGTDMTAEGQWISSVYFFAYH